MPLCRISLFTLGMLIGFGRYAMHHGAMVALGVPAGFSYLWPRIGLSLAVWTVIAAFVALSYLVPHVASSKVRSVLSICGFLGALLLMLSTEAKLWSWCLQG